MGERWHSVRETALLLDVSKWTVYRLIAAGDLAATDMRPTGSRRAKTRISESAIAAFTSGRTRTAPKVRTR